MSQERPKRDPAVNGRVNMVNGRFDLPVQTVSSMSEIHAVASEAANKIASIVERNEKYNVGRLIAAIDKLQEAKNNACDSLILPPRPASVKVFISEKRLNTPK